MAVPKKVKTVAGTTPATPTATSSDNPVEPLNLKTLYAAVLQLQNTVNEVIAKYNAHTHVENTAGAYAQNASTAAPAGGNLVAGGAGSAATNLFTTN